ncbi:GH92 family glycosyl hydrolase [Actinopolymorpha pittospori]|uniref:Alpha-1,2-mannosidase n=1 Tax=Actinopolymorpha pittospori TaxID=648752 RepID=A0A927N885_9ACTN|nr:GH92 family glycosyl hydrolase [Actinopolymorpha pittospori]MBE1610767.1 putative alpha-1,2-mannosidase [Actinopolymorpha pittospori]
MANSFTAHAGPGNGSAPGAPAAASVAAPAGIVPGGSDGTTVHFFSSFEPGDPRPRSDGQDGTGSGVTTSVGAGPDHAPAAKAQVGFSGGSALAYAGRAADAGSAHARVRLFDVRIEVNADTELSYVLFPEFTAGDLGYPATYAAIDLEFADGSHLSELGVRDQHGFPLTPSGQGASRSLSADQWNLRRAALGEVAAGRTITGIRLGYDNPNGPADFRGWIDDVAILDRPAPAGPTRLSDLVITTRGTHSSGAFSRGNNIPATALPLGFNFWIPVTDAGSTSWVYEYHRANNADNLAELQAFAVSHQTSPWMGDRQTFQVLPSDATGTPDADRATRALPFRHENETARPHYYAVTFENGISTEIAPTDHAAIFRFTFTGPSSTLLFDNVNANASLTVDPDTGVVTGFSDVRSRLSNGATRMFVYAEFDQPVVEAGRPEGAEDRTEAAAYVRFDPTTAHRTVTMRIATSLLGVEQAERNLRLEIAAEDSFEDVRERAQQRWDETLGVIEVEGAGEDQLRTFYSNLYRLFLYPNAAHENTGTVAEPVHVHAVQSATTTPPSSPTRTGAAIVPGKVYVNNGFWDTYRTTWPAYALLTPRLAGELVDGFLQQYRDGGWVARWSSPGYTNLMVGTSSDVAFADAFLKDVEGFDPETAYRAAVKNATVRPPDDHVGRKGFDTAVFLGYTAAEATEEAMSWALDGYINDFGIAMMAGRLAEIVGPEDQRYARYREEQEYFLRRSLGYVHLFDPSVGFFQGRHADGSRRLPPSEFDPRVWGHDYTETNAWNMAFHVPHDGAGLAALYGGRAGLAAKLDEFFATPETGEEAFRGSYSSVIHEMTEARDVRMGMYGHSNQPSHHILYMYNYVGQPAKTQEKVRDVLARLYLGSEIGQGYPGDEDNGEMSAWQVFSALGYYPLQMGSPRYAVGSPLFTRATIHLESGADLVINAPDNSPENVYVQGLTVNGAAYDRTWLPHGLLAAGGVLEFAMGPRPSTWGTAPGSEPPSVTPAGTAPAPLVDVTGPGLGTPHASGDVDAAVLFDDTSATSVTFAGTERWVQFDLDGPARVEFYTLTSAAQGSAATSWVLSGSNDGTDWTVLDPRTGEEFEWPRQTRPFRVATPGSYGRYRLDLGSGSGEIAALAQVELLALRLTIRE